VDPADLDALARTRALLIVDVRSPDEYVAGHVTGAINVPLDALEGRVGELRRDALVVTVCGKGGGRSERAASVLRAHGFSQVRSLCGGTDGWRKQAARGAGS
jgi:rhodanese-related sulfurtransferase